MRLLLSITLLFLVTACGPSPEQSETNGVNSYGNPVVSPEELIADHLKWWDYHYKQINLTADFLPLDPHGVEIPKRDFIKALNTGEHITVELKSTGDRPVYQLFILERQDVPTIAAMMKSATASEMQHYLMEGQQFPPFTVEDLEGRAYDNKSLIGKTTVFKTWFIACKPCIAEFPAVNALAGKYADNEKVQFISLAIDKAPQLKSFLAGNPLRYATVAEQKHLIQKDLKLQAFPTHLVVGPDGKILKVINKIVRLEEYLASTIP